MEIGKGATPHTFNELTTGVSPNLEIIFMMARGRFSSPCLFLREYVANDRMDMYISNRRAGVRTGIDPWSMKVDVRVWDGRGYGGQLYNTLTRHS